MSTAHNGRPGKGQVAQSTLNTNTTKTLAADEVFEQMQQLLINGTWTPGTKLPSENELANRYGVSRVSIRAAIAKLKVLNLVETRHGSGSYVSEVRGGEPILALVQTAYLGGTSDHEIFQYRNIIECGSLPLAIANETQEDLEYLNRLCHSMIRSAEKDDVTEFASLDWQFHQKIGQMTNNPLITRTNEILEAILKQSMITVIEHMRYRNGIAYHEQILEAMREHDSNRAVALMRSHIQANIDFFS